MQRGSFLSTLYVGLIAAVLCVFPAHARPALRPGRTPPCAIACSSSSTVWMPKKSRHARPRRRA